MPSAQTAVRFLACMAPMRSAARYRNRKKSETLQMCHVEHINANGVASTPISQRKRAEEEEEEGPGVRCG